MTKVVYWLTEDGLAEAYQWAADGLAASQIAKHMGVHPRTVEQWIADHPSFAAAVRAGRQDSAGKVENALFRRAMGYAYSETKTVTRADPRGEDGTVTEVTVTEKQQAPDVLAQIFFLKNKDPKNWRDRREVELDGTVGLVQIVDDLGTVDADPLLG